MLILPTEYGVAYIGRSLVTDDAPGADGILNFTGLRNDGCPLLIRPQFEAVISCPWCTAMVMGRTETISSCYNCMQPSALLFFKLPRWLRIYPYLNPEAEVMNQERFELFVDFWDQLLMEFNF
jgi:hypothetical protein